jgi:hypothetical protein
MPKIASFKIFCSMMDKNTFIYRESG